MKGTLTPDAENAIADIARRYDLSRDAVLAMLVAVRAGGGSMAQFSIPELGGSGQWMRGGMTMVGDMFDHSLKARVDALCTELAQLLSSIPVFPAGTAPGVMGANWWPAELGVPSAAGGQNDIRYAVFPASRRLAVQIQGTTRVFDTGEHRIGGVAQQQQGGPGSVSFTSQFGTFDLSSLAESGVRPPAPPPRHREPERAPQPQPQPQHRRPETAPPQQDPVPAAGRSDDPAAIIAAIESLAGLRDRGILSDEEFATKKAELLGRL